MEKLTCLTNQPFHSAVDIINNIWYYYIIISQKKKNKLKIIDKMKMQLKEKVKKIKADIPAVFLASGTKTHRLSQKYSPL